MLHKQFKYVTKTAVGAVKETFEMFTLPNVTLSQDSLMINATEANSSNACDTTILSRFVSLLHDFGYVVYVSKRY